MSAHVCARDLAGPDALRRDARQSRPGGDPEPPVPVDVADVEHLVRAQRRARPLDLLGLARGLGNVEPSPTWGQTRPRPPPTLESPATGRPLSRSSEAGKESNDHARLFPGRGREAP